MDDLLTEFVAETREMLEAIGGELIAWEADPADTARLDAIFRFVHTVKGNCGFFHFPRLERLSHAAESALSDVRAQKRVADSALVTAILAIVDRIGILTDAIEAGGDTPTNESDDEPLIGALDGGTDGPRNAFATDNSLSPPLPISAPRSIRLPVALLDRVMNGVSDMVLARNDLARRLRDSGREPALDGSFERLSAILSDMRADITQMRMLRIDRLYGMFPRLVRDIAVELGKQVTFNCEGGRVELDREMIEMIRDPMMHLIRNAIDHGIESPAARLAAGKPECGTVRIESRQSGNMISILVADDGGGLDIDRIGEQAIAAGLFTRARWKARSDQAKAALIFEPGLSTADRISALSGRGVGMDVVKSNIAKIGGTITVATSAGEGTQFTLHLPLTLSIVSALTVSVAGRMFAVPHSYIEEIAHGRSAAVAIERIGDRDLLTFRGRRVPCVTLNTVLEVEPRRPDIDQCLVVLRLGGNDLFALTVDQVHDQEDLVVKPLPPAIMNARIYAGTTLLDDGRPVPMLDIPAIVERYCADNGNLSSTEPEPGKDHAHDPIDRRTVMLFTDFGNRRRAMPLALIARIDQVNVEACQANGGGMHCVVDDRILPVVGNIRSDHEADIAGRSKDSIMPVLRLSDGVRELVYPIVELHDTATIDGPLTPTPDDPTTAGIALIDGEAVPVMDGLALFGETTDPAAPQRKPMCQLPLDNEWATTMLKPLIEAAGYSIANHDDDAHIAAADVRFVMSDAAIDDSDASTNTIILHDDADPQSKTDRGIYRYDRAAIAAALEKTKAS